ncbi:MAG: hypothetical protein HW375_1591 [Anaerolineales bacterium]|nr:hypothetical protein [Anaerolineales bacterium]
MIDLRQALVIDVQVIGRGRSRPQSGARPEAAAHRRGELDPSDTVEPVERLIHGRLQGLGFLPAAVAAGLSQPLRRRLPLRAGLL